MYIIRKLKQKEILSFMSFWKHFFIAVTNGLSVAQLISCTKAFCCKSYLTSLLFVIHLLQLVFSNCDCSGTAWHTLDVCVASTTTSFQPGWALPVPIFIWIIANPRPKRVLRKQTKAKQKDKCTGAKDVNIFLCFIDGIYLVKWCIN